MGKVIKLILQRITKEVIEKTKVNLWRNRGAVLEWLGNLNKKTNFAFIAFDIVDFYPSISEELLTAAIEFARKITNTTDEEIKTVFHARRSILCTNDSIWIKKTGEFDVTMGSFDGAETCEIAGEYLFNKIKTEYGSSFGLNRDDGLGAINDSPKNIENIKKGICAIFKQHGLNITIEANKEIVNFLDVSLDIG